MTNAFITGTSSGLGRGLADVFSRRGWQVYGCSRRGCNLPGMEDRICDLTNHDALPGILSELLEPEEYRRLFDQAGHR